MRFTKMHGCKNDFVIVNCFDENVDKPSDVALKVCDRRDGIGAAELMRSCRFTIQMAQRTQCAETAFDALRNIYTITG